MKKFIALFCLVTLGYAFPIESSYETAHKKAIDESKALMVFLTKKGSPLCNLQLLNIFTQKDVAELIEKRAVFVVVYKEQYGSYPIELLYTLEYPTLFFLDRYELFFTSPLKGVIPPDKVKQKLLEYD